MKKEQLKQVIKVRVSEREYGEIGYAAKQEQRTVSDYIRLKLRSATALTLAGTRRKEPK